jgi:hypothetical protein
MSELDDLPPDQRAVLQLLLAQGQTYDELGDLLAIDAAGVRVRAHAAVSALGGEAGRQLLDERRGEIADYLLGQQSVSEREATRQHLAGSAAARAWARVVAGPLRSLATEPLPEIPEDAAEAAVEPRHDDALAEGGRAPSVAPPGERPRDREPFRAPAGIELPRSSRLGGAMLLGGLGILLAVVLVLILSGGGGGSKSSSTVGSVSSTPAGTGTGTGTTPSPVAQINLFPAQSGSRAVGLAQVFVRGNQRLLIVAGQGLQPGAYALWLYSSPSKARLLGFVPQRVGKTGRFVTQGAVPADASSFTQLVVTREQVPSGSAAPKQPGPIVLRGKLQLG